MAIFLSQVVAKSQIHKIFKSQNLTTFLRFRQFFLSCEVNLYFASTYKVSRSNNNLEPLNWLWHFVPPPPVVRNLSFLSRNFFKTNRCLLSSVDICSVCPTSFLFSPVYSSVLPLLHPVVKHLQRGLNGQILFYVFKINLKCQNEEYFLVGHLVCFRENISIFS